MRQTSVTERKKQTKLGQPPLEEIDSLKGGRANYWHTDVTFVDRPPAFTLLHAVVIPPVGGDTLWASTVSASCWGSPRRRRDLIRVLQDYIIRPEQTVR